MTRLGALSRLVEASTYERLKPGMLGSAAVAVTAKAVPEGDLDQQPHSQEGTHSFRKTAVY